MSDGCKADWEMRSRPDVRVQVSAVDYASYQRARQLSRGGDGRGHWAKEAMRLHLQLFYKRTELDGRDIVKTVTHPLLQGMR